VNQELAEQLGEEVHCLAPRNDRCQPDRAKLCATNAGFVSPTRFATFSDGRPLATDALSPPTSLSSSRPKQADAWLLDPSDHLAARLARDGNPEAIAFEETDTSFQIAWPGAYRLDGPAFIYTDRHTETFWPASRFSVTY